MNTEFPDLSITGDTVPGSRDDVAANQGQAVPAPNGAIGAVLPLSVTERTRHRRLRHLGRPDRAWLYAVLDAALVAHLGVVIGGRPMVVPTVYGFDADTHRSSGAHRDLRTRCDQPSGH